MKFTIVVSIASLLVSCAGPTSPFGGIHLSSGDGAALISVSKVNERSIPEAKLSPARQNLHMPYPLEITFKGDSGFSNQLQLVYNGREVTQTWKRRAQTVGTKNGETSLRFEPLTLSPRREHRIEFRIGSSMVLHHEKPTCDLRDQSQIVNLQPFPMDTQIVKSIEQLSRRYNINPSFIAGLIAQESSFNPKAVSAAKAVGLTQITPIAQLEVQKIKPDWKFDLNHSSSAASQIERMISSGRMNGKNDWRLNTHKSIEGGIIYLNYLKQYWSLPEHVSLKKNHKSISELDLLLASYNSGAKRVKNSILELGPEWKNHPELKEAFAYSNKIASFCYHFGRERDRQ